MYNQIAANKRKTVFILMGFFAFVTGLSLVVSYYLVGDPSATVLVLIFAAIYALVSYFSAGKMATALHGAKEVTAKEEKRLFTIVENLAITNGMPMPKVYVMEDPGLNAFATGRDPDHAIVAATRGLIDSLDDSELQGVMAHELGHVKNYDIRVSMIAFALVTVIALICDLLLRSFWFGGDRDNDKAAGIFVVVALVAAVLAPIAASLLQLAISRRREFLADATGALTTRYPEGLASALAKIGAHSSTLKRQHTATAHLFFANPLQPGKFVSGLFSTHPPIEERIARLHDMGDEL